MFELLTPKLGQLVNIAQPELSELWWQQSILTSQVKWHDTKAVVVN